ncbi:hypothetical protein ACO3VM_05490 [Methanocaldococcus sp. 10A]
MKKVLVLFGIFLFLLICGCINNSNNNNENTNNIKEFKVVPANEELFKEFVNKISTNRYSDIACIGAYGHTLKKAASTVATTESTNINIERFFPKPMCK